MRSQGEPEYVNEILNLSDKNNKSLGDNGEDGQLDDLYETALEIVKSEGKASTSFCRENCKLAIIELQE